MNIWKKYDCSELDSMGGDKMKYQNKITYLLNEMK